MFSSWITAIHEKRNCRTPTRHSLHISTIRDTSAELLFAQRKKSQQPRHWWGCVWPVSLHSCTHPFLPDTTYIWTQTEKADQEIEWHRAGRNQHHICHFEKEKRCYLRCWMSITLAVPPGPTRKRCRRHISKEKPLLSASGEVLPPLIIKHISFLNILKTTLCLGRINVTTDIFHLFFGNWKALKYAF